MIFFRDAKNSKLDVHEEEIDEQEEPGEEGEEIEEHWRTGLGDASRQNLFRSLLQILF